jgi:hypothetical protein
VDREPFRSRSGRAFGRNGEGGNSYGPVEVLDTLKAWSFLWERGASHRRVLRRDDNMDVSHAGVTDLPSFTRSLLALEGWGP